MRRVTDEQHPPGMGRLRAAETVSGRGRLGWGPRGQGPCGERASRNGKPSQHAGVQATQALSSFLQLHALSQGGSDGGGTNPSRIRVWGQADVENGGDVSGERGARNSEGRRGAVVGHRLAAEQLPHEGGASIHVGEWRSGLPRSELGCGVGS
jgi:hypothetical protein